MLVFPLREADSKEFMKPLQQARSGFFPGAHSAKWYLKHIIVDDDVFTRGDEDSEPSDTEEPPQFAFMEKFKGGFPGGFSAEAEPDSSTAEDDMKVQADADMADAYKRARHATTFGQLQEVVIELVVRYLLCRYCGFKVRAFTSVDGDELFVAVSCNDVVLRAHADLMEFKLQLDPELSVELLCTRGGIARQIDPQQREQLMGEGIYPPFLNYIYDMDEQYYRTDGKKSRYAWRRYTDTFPAGSAFRSSDRIRIIRTVLEKTFRFGKMMNLNLLQAYFPCHHELCLVSLSQDWGNPWNFYRLNLPVDDIADYFGEAVAFRMAHTSFQSIAVLPLAVSVPMLLAIQSFSPEWAMAVTGTLLIVWSSIHGTAYSRVESHYRMAWGMEDHTHQDAVRADFDGQWSHSDVDRRTPIKVDPCAFWRRCATGTATAFFIGLVVTTTTLWYKYEKETAGVARWVTIAIAVQMQVYTKLWQYLANWITNFENHAHVGDYYEALVFRVFIFQFFNSFASIFYLALFKHLGAADSAVAQLEVRSQLRCIFAINMFFHALGMAMPLLQYRWDLYNERKALMKKDGYGVLAPATVHSFQEAQAKLPEYTLAEEIWDHNDALIELTFVLFFGFMAPEIILLCFISNLARARALGWTVCHALRRPFPRQGKGIGRAFSTLHSLIGRLAIAVNIVLQLVYNAGCGSCSSSTDKFAWLKEMLARPDPDIERQLDWKAMMVAFFFLFHLLRNLSMVCEQLLPAESYTVDLARRRRKAIEEALRAKMMNTGHRNDLDVALSKAAKNDRKLNISANDTRQRRARVGWRPVDVRDALGDEIPKMPADDNWFRPADCLDSHPFTSASGVSHVTPRMESPRGLAITDSVVGSLIA